ncbi:tetratricopeptide repeat protein [Brachybacterium halotolerans subsp. kimchii]|uniref:co-chaperone YbbN n=1 Tax=Brachybacterium halotolerans TaxID=2795215 RepID=UPI001E5922F9|nr:tetratricopeptide repeat protein [Brachybacterium halotolerans]UEJ82888.1 tetratricopeptide repeat protein [Brachybacterium halotolerans subsp. kimchii]
MTDPYGVIDLASLKKPEGSENAGPVGEHEVSVDEANLEQMIQDSARVATLLLVTSSRVPGIDELLGALRSGVDAKGGALRLAVVDADTQPRVAGALRVQQLPTLMLLLQGQLQPIAESMVPADQIPGLLDQIVQVAQQTGLDVSGAADGQGADGSGAEDADGAAPAQPELPPLLQTAYDAIEAGDLPGAQTAFEEHLNQNPADAEAKAGLATVHLMDRTRDAQLDAARKAAADAPQDLDAQLLVADLDMLGGHVDDAFGRLLDLLRGADQDTKDRVRARLLDLFEVAGPEDPRVAPARKRLANLLF